VELGSGHVYDSHGAEEGASYLLGVQGAPNLRIQARRVFEKYLVAGIPRTCVFVCRHKEPAVCRLCAGLTAKNHVRNVGIYTKIESSAFLFTYLCRLKYGWLRSLQGRPAGRSLSSELLPPALPARLCCARCTSLHQRTALRNALCCSGWLAVTAVL